MHIDWLTLTCDRSAYTYDSDVKTEPSFVRNYKIMRRLSPHMTVHAGHNISDKDLVIITGATAHHMAKHLLAPSFVKEFDVTVSRVDIAYDLLIPEQKFMTICEFWDMVKTQRVPRSPKFETAKYIGSKQGVETVYLGDMRVRSKKGLFRAYDKGLEQGGRPNTWSRFELELRKKQADSNAKLWGEGRMKLSQIIGKFVSLPNGMTEVMTEYPRLRLNEKESEESEANFWQWVERVFSPIAIRLGEGIASGSPIATGIYERFLTKLVTGYENEVKRRHEAMSSEHEDFIRQHKREIEIQKQNTRLRTERMRQNKLI